MINYRRAMINDIGTLTAMRIDMLCEDTEYSEDFIMKLRGNTIKYMEEGFADNSYIAWVAEISGSIVAMGGLTIFALPPNDWCINGKSAYLGNMYTLPEYRKKGIASKLLHTIVEEAKSADIERILLHATDMGRSLYVNYGFEASDTAMAYYTYGKGDRSIV